MASHVPLDNLNPWVQYKTMRAVTCATRDDPVRMYHAASSQNENSRWMNVSSMYERPPPGSSPHATLSRHLSHNNYAYSQMLKYSLYMSINSKSCHQATEHYRLRSSLDEHPCRALVDTMLAGESVVSSTLTISQFTQTGMFY
jgi:hypothetical protein